jgi:hypothetical protein
LRAKRRRKRFFFAKKTKKLLSVGASVAASGAALLPTPALPKRGREKRVGAKRGKVFWFFSSEKNGFLP